MKKIKSIKQLQLEKKRILNHQENIENRIRNNWNDLKEILKPVNLAKQTYNRVLHNKMEQSMENESVFKSTLTYGVNLLVQKFADKTEDKVIRLFKKKVK